MESVIKTCKLHKSYRGVKAITDINLDVMKGEVFGYLGPNGSGKTTTIRVLLDFIRPSSGQAMLFGMDSHEFSRDIRRRIGYLPGDVMMYDRLTGHEFISYMANLRGGVDFEYVDLLALRLESDLSRPIKTLSRGNVQKIGLIQAFMNRPELILMDEPSTGLDPLLQQEFYKMIDEVRGDGRTVFISSHILPEVERVCDRVAIIRDGDLVAVEDVDSLRGRAPRQVKFQFASPVEAVVFEGITGVLQAELKEGVMECTIQGSPDPLIKKAAQYEIVNIVSEEPHLEDIFLAYYSESGGDVK